MENLYKKILSVFDGEKIDNFYIWGVWSPVYGFEETDEHEWGDKNGEWDGEKYDKYIDEEKENYIISLIEENFDMYSEFSYCRLYWKLELLNKRLTFSIEEDETEVGEIILDGFTIGEGGKIVDIPEDYNGVFIEWEINEKGIKKLN